MGFLELWDVYPKLYLKIFNLIFFAGFAFHRCAVAIMRLVSETGWLLYPRSFPWLNTHLGPHRQEPQALFCFSSPFQIRLITAWLPSSSKAFCQAPSLRLTVDLGFWRLYNLSSIVHLWPIDFGLFFLGTLGLLQYSSGGPMSPLSIQQNQGH